jgi:hypothetical protein
MFTSERKLLYNYSSRDDTLSAVAQLSKSILIRMQLNLQASPRSYLKPLVTTTTDAPHQHNNWGDQEGCGKQRSKGCPYRHVRNACNITHTLMDVLCSTVTL